MEHIVSLSKNNSKSKQSAYFEKITILHLSNDYFSQGKIFDNHLHE